MSESADAAKYRSPLFDFHVSAGARMVVRDGWAVPADYGNPDDECARLHERAAVLDLTPNGRIRVRGDGALGMLERLCTADVARQEDDTALRSLLLNDSGGVIDLVTIFRLDGWWVVNTSPGRREAVLAHLVGQAESFGAKVDDQTLKTMTLAVVGPAGAEILDRFLPNKPSKLAPGQVKTGSMFIASYIAARTGQTDLWSLQVTLPNMLAGQAWKYVIGKSGESSLAPAGADAAELLRLEAHLPRWGNEMDEQTDAISAGLADWICFEKDFLGAAAVAEARQARASQSADGQAMLRAAWQAGPAGEAGRSAPVARGSKLLDTAGNVIGTVTSAAFSPTAGAWLGQARGPSAMLGEGSTVGIAAGDGTRLLATVKKAF